MKFDEWLKKEEKTVAEVSRELDLTHCVVLKWANGEQIPREENMLRLVELTHGEVMPNDFYGVGEKETTEAEA